MVSINSAVGQRIVYYRKQKGLKQYELAAIVGIKCESLSNIETGVVMVEIPRLARIAWALGVSLKDLLGDGGEEG